MDLDRVLRARVKGRHELLEQGYRTTVVVLLISRRGHRPCLSAAPAEATGDRSHASTIPYGRTRMIVCPLMRSVGLNAATASSRDATLPMFVRSRPSRTRWTISRSWA